MPLPMNSAARGFTAKNAGWLLFGFGLGILLFRSLDSLQTKSRIASAQATARKIEKACVEYSMEHDGRLPENVEVMLTRDEFGKGPYLTSETLTDPWGRVFLYDAEGACQCGVGAFMTRPDIYCLVPNGQVVGNFRKWTASP
jgi:hypothetical protein